VEALQKNDLSSESDLFIFSDAAKSSSDKDNVNEVRNYINNIDGFNKITTIERNENWGLANSIIDGVTTIFKDYGKVIVLEDDLITGSYFLKFMNEALVAYESRDDIFSVTGFNYPPNTLNIPSEYNDEVYLNYRFMCWSWGTWKDRWSKVDWSVKRFAILKKDKKEIRKFNRGGEDLYPMLQSQMEGKIDSWAIRFCFAHTLHESFCVYPVLSLVNNEGFDGSGVHCHNDDGTRLKNSLSNVRDIKINKYILLNDDLLRNFLKIHKRNLIQKIKTSLKQYI
jgi:hypothetical protein